MIKGKRITIKRFETEKEVETFIKLYNILPNRSLHDHTDLTNPEERLNSFKKGEFNSNDQSNYMLLNEDNLFIGTIGYTKKSPWELNVGYRILLPEYRQNGYLSEALPLFLKYIFENHLDIDRISLCTAFDNVGSQKVAVRSGFTYEGTMRKAYEYRGRRVDFLLYSILRSDMK